ncbi:MAG: 23S rRNA (uracil(1939)-C(5))-methyltransferase RlmD [Lachnospiraceae bacterium]|nr:23S rRNA (uracil(1939)-C(5))-methyltransferase RlmD [Lachnospiraceae bacterium]
MNDKNNYANKKSFKGAPSARQNEKRSIAANARQSEKHNDFKSVKQGARHAEKPNARQSEKHNDFKSIKQGARQSEKRTGVQNARQSEKRTGAPSISFEKKRNDSKPKSSFVETDKSVRTQKTSLCPVSKRCGGCQYIDMPYDKQLKLKQKKVEQLIGGFVKPEKIVGMDEPFHYRNKVHAVLDVNRGKIISGVYEEGTHDVVPVKTCMIEDKLADEIIQSIVSLLPSFKIKAYCEDTGYGYLRHILIRVGHSTGQVMVVLVAGDPVFPSKNNFIKALRTKHPEITTIVLNINDKKTSMVLGDREIVLYGKGYIEDELCGRRFIISPKSFYQVNPVQTEKLYNKAIEYAHLTGNERVIDAYCGIGTIGITAAGKAGEVIGVELNPDAVKDAVKNARLNAVKNISFYKNDASDFMQNMAASGETADVVIMDPPRAGSDERFMDAVALLAPEKVVYISCAPETLARDLEYFAKKGYRAKKAQAFDMFPMTGHVEVVSLLQRLSNTRERTITLDVEMEDYHRIKNGTGVTADATE